MSGNIQLKQPQGGKLPPQAIEFEAAVLGALMLEKEALVLVGGSIKPPMMYLDRHKDILTAIQDLVTAGDPVDILTVTNKLKVMGKLQEVGGAYYITELTSNVSSSANIEYHARILQEMYMKRRSIAKAHKIMEMAFDDSSDCFEILDFDQNEILDALSDIDNGATRSIKEIGKEVLKDIAHKMTIKGGMTGVDTGFLELNNITGGWQNTNLIILAARPAMGKTSMAIRWLCAAAKAGMPAAMFSLEMGSKQLVKRILAQETHVVGGSDMEKGKLQDYQFEALMNLSNKIFNHNIFIDDTAELSISSLRSKAYKLKMQHGIKLIVIDYLQLMSAKGSGNREQEIAAIARGLKKIAKELDIPVIALSQLSRSVETRGGDKRPNLSDLRESGAIEQDADMVMFLYRAKYYGITEDSEGNSTAGVGEIIIGKHRNGSLDSVFTKWIGRFTDFRDKDVSDTALPPPKETIQTDDYSWMTNKNLPDQREF